MNLGGSDKAVRQRYGIARWRIDSLFERFIAKKQTLANCGRKPMYIITAFSTRSFLRMACRI